MVGSRSMKGLDSKEVNRTPEDDTPGVHAFVCVCVCAHMHMRALSTTEMYTPGIYTVALTVF